jgi:hypothetical protein
MARKQRVTPRWRHFSNLHLDSENLSCTKISVQKVEQDQELASRFCGNFLRTRSLSSRDGPRALTLNANVFHIYRAAVPMGFHRSFRTSDGHLLTHHGANYSPSNLLCIRHAWKRFVASIMSVMQNKRATETALFTPMDASLEPTMTCHSST